MTKFQHDDPTSAREALAVCAADRAEETTA